MALYKDMPNRSDDTSDPAKTVERVLDIAHVLFHLDQVGLNDTAHLMKVLVEGESNIVGGA